MTISEMIAILRGEVKFYDSPEDVQSKLNEIADELERLSAERDAAVSDMHSHKCWVCKHRYNDDICVDCLTHTDRFEWRGVQHARMRVNKH